MALELDSGPPLPPKIQSTSASTTALWPVRALGAPVVATATQSCVCREVRLWINGTEWDNVTEDEYCGRSVSKKQKNFWKYVNFSMEASNKPLSWPGHPNSASHLSLNLMTPAYCMSNSGLGPQQKCDATVSRVCSWWIPQLSGPRDLVLCFTSMKTIPIATLPLNLLYDVLRPTLLTMNRKIYTSNPPMSDRKGAWNTVGIATPKRTAKNPYAEVGVQCCALVAAFLISSVSWPSPDHHLFWTFLTNCGFKTQGLSTKAQCPDLAEGVLLKNTDVHVISYNSEGKFDLSFWS